MSDAQFVDFKRTERGVDGREVRGEGVPRTMLFCVRADRELAIRFEGHRFANIQFLNKMTLK